MPERQIRGMIGANLILNVFAVAISGAGADGPECGGEERKAVRLWPAITQSRHGWNGPVQRDLYPTKVQ